MSTVPPRLHVVPATGCDKALILRRGPADRVATLLWDRAADTFQMGQWLAGRIYEHRSDLSSDARHMVYFAGTGKRWWTAVSRAPWLRATDFYPQDHTWHGGGAFDEQGRLWLNGFAHRNAPLPDGLQAADVTAFPAATDGFHMGNLFAEMMKLRGWAHQAGARYDICLTKRLWAGWGLELTIRLLADNRALISNCYTLVHPKQGVRLEQPEWEWAEPFGHTLQFAQNGAVHRASLAENGALGEQQVIRDFSDMSFQEIAAPYDGVTDRDGFQ